MKSEDSLDFSCKHTHRHLHSCVVLDVSLFLCSDACDLTLDPNTAYTRFILSDENKITRVKDNQPYPDHPERFDDAPQVLCVESFFKFSHLQRMERSVIFIVGAPQR